VVSLQDQGNGILEEEVSSPIWFTSVSVGYSTQQSSETRQILRMGESEATRRFVRVAFWVDDGVAPVFETTTNYPDNWTPRLYLSALKLTIKRNKLVYCDCRLPGAAVLNEVHFLFSGTFENAFDVLESQNAQHELQQQRMLLFLVFHYQPRFTITRKQQ
jgi:hypothetical protein